MQSNTSVGSDRQRHRERERERERAPLVGELVKLHLLFALPFFSPSSLFLSSPRSLSLSLPLSHFLSLSISLSLLFPPSDPFVFFSSFFFSSSAAINRFSACAVHSLTASRPSPPRTSRRATRAPRARVRSLIDALAGRSYVYLSRPWGGEWGETLKNKLHGVSDHQSWNN